MTHISPATAVRVWLFLVVATVTSGWLVEHHSVAGRWTAAAVMLVAALKGRAVLLYFHGTEGRAPWVARDLRAVDLAVRRRDRGAVGGRRRRCLKIAGPPVPKQRAGIPKDARPFSRTPCLRQNTSTGLIASPVSVALNASLMLSKR